MFKKILLAITIFSLIIFPLTPVSAQTTLTVTDSGVETNFPQYITFKVSAQSSVNITDIRLQYSIETIGFAKVINEAYVRFTPSTQVDTQWQWDLTRIGGLPPGTTVSYQWLLLDADGNSIKTPIAEVQFNDERFSWKSITEGKATLYWYEGTQSFAEELMDTTRSALERLQENTGAVIEKPIRLYIYNDQTDLLGAMIFPQEWTGGAAFPGFGCIVIGISASNIDWGKRAITHELTHLVIGQVTLNPYNSIPTWLDEGLAMYNEGPMEITFVNNLAMAIQENRLISVQSLCSPFSAYSYIAYVSYAESYSIVDFLITNYGTGKMAELLETFHQGSTYNGALLKVYGFDMDELNTMWQASLISNE